MLTAIEIENFKGVSGCVRIELAPITLLFGPNSVGKSTVLHALQYAHEVLSRRNPNPDATEHGADRLSLGGFQNLVHRTGSEGPTVEVPIRIALEFDLHGLDLHSMSEDEFYAWGGDPGPFFGVEDRFETGRIEFVVRWSELRQTALVTELVVGVNGTYLVRLEASSDGAQVTLRKPNLTHPILNFAGDPYAPETEPELDEWRALREQLSEQDLWIGVTNLGRSALPQWGEQLEFDERWGLSTVEASEPLDTGEDGPLGEWEQARLSLLISAVGARARDEIANLRYIGPMRDVIARSYLPPSLTEIGRWASGVAAWDLLHERGASFWAAVGMWLVQPHRLDTGYGLRMREIHQLADDTALMASVRNGTVLDDYPDLEEAINDLPRRRELRLVDAETGIALDMSDVGTGISQVLPVVVAALDPDRPGITAIEQPELHIHPRVQVALGDLFIEQIKSGDGIFLLETHSEHLMLRLLRRIQETTEGELPESEDSRERVGVARHPLSLRPDEVSVLYVDKSHDGVRVHPLRVDERGEFVDAWPGGFFEERGEELV